MTKAHGSRGTYQSGFIHRGRYYRRQICTDFKHSGDIVPKCLCKTVSAVNAGAQSSHIGLRKVEYEQNGGTSGTEGRHSMPPP